MGLARHVADGSGTDIVWTNADVRFTPQADMDWHGCDVRDLCLGDVTTDRYTDSAGLREDVIS